MLAMLQRLGIAASFSRPARATTNAICEAIFRTMKDTPCYPRKSFASLEEASVWGATFVTWHNDAHCIVRSGTYAPRPARETRDVAILAARKVAYAAARERAPRRWTGATRDSVTSSGRHPHPQGGNRAALIISDDNYADGSRSSAASWASCVPTAVRYRPHRPTAARSFSASSYPFGGIVRSTTTRFVIAARALSQRPAVDRSIPALPPAP